MTEDEAKTKWCPSARVSASKVTADGNLTTDERVPAHNRHAVVGQREPTLHPSANCIGSGCMAWRYGQKRNPNWKPRHGMIAYSEVHPDDTAPMYVEDRTVGYCGLAGRQ